jgi:hypothetical protein
VVTVDGAAGVTISGFRIEAAASQHAIELRGKCPGTRVEDCQINCASDSPVAAVYLHSGASGTASKPISLNRLRIRCGGVGVVLGGLEDHEPVSRVELVESFIQGPGRDYGVGVVLQVGARQVSVRRNIFSTATAGVSLSFELPDHASEVEIAQNSIGDVRYAFTLNESSPKQDVRISRNLVVDSESLQVSTSGIDPYVPWFQGNWWEKSSSTDVGLVTRVAKLTDPLTLLSRDPGAASYLKPAGMVDFVPGRYSAPPTQD